MQAKDEPVRHNLLGKRDRERPESPKADVGETVYCGSWFEECEVPSHRRIEFFSEAMSLAFTLQRLISAPCIVYITMLNICKMRLCIQITCSMRGALILQSSYSKNLVGL